MALLNYSTTVPAAKSVATVQTTLAKHGARELHLTFDESGNATAIEFAVMTKHGMREFRLPAEVNRVHQTLKNQYARKVGGITLRHTNYEHARAVSWRIVLAWLEAQLALIEAGLADIEEIMLPYMIANQNGQTVYQILTNNRLLLPAGKNGD